MYFPIFMFYRKSGNNYKRLYIIMGPSEYFGWADLSPDTYLY